MNREELLKVAAERIYVAPNIPADKLRNALASYAPGIALGDVLVLVDDTLWGGAREGIILTEKTLYSKMYCASPESYRLDMIRELRIEKKHIYVNDEKFFTIYGPSVTDVRRLVDFIAAHCAEIRAKASEATAAKPAVAPESDGEPASAGKKEIVPDDCKRFENDLLSRLPISDQNIWVEICSDLKTGHKLKSAYNFAEDFLNKMLSVSVEERNDAFRRDVIAENAEDRLIIATACNLMSVAICFPNYINRSKKFDPRLLKFLQGNELLTFELLIYVLYRVQVMLMKHLEREGLQYTMELILDRSLMLYVQRKHPLKQEHSLDGLAVDPRVQIMNNPILTHYRRHNREYHEHKDKNPGNLLAEYTFKAIGEHCLAQVPDKSKVGTLIGEVLGLYGERVIMEIPEYQAAADKQIDRTLFELLR